MATNGHAYCLSPGRCFGFDAGALAAIPGQRLHHVGHSVGLARKFRQLPCNTRCSCWSLSERSGDDLECIVQLIPGNRPWDVGNLTYGLAHEIQRIADPHEPLRTHYGTGSQFPAGICEYDQMSSEVS